jgi:hypothetical protein
VLLLLYCMITVTVLCCDGRMAYLWEADSLTDGLELLPHQRTSGGCEDDLGLRDRQQQSWPLACSEMKVMAVDILYVLAYLDRSDALTHASCDVGRPMHFEMVCAHVFEVRRARRTLGNHL